MTGQTMPVTFPNKDGLRLFGILHLPGQRREPDPAILLLSPGIKTRVAPHGLYKAMAERFVALGYPVLRFDFYGLGDSEGDLQETYLADLYGAIQVGRYMSDTIAAMDWMQKTHGVSQFIASGLCGGAITGLLAAARDPRITGLLGLCIPVILDGAHIDFTRYMTLAELEGTRNGYLRKLRLWEMDVWRSWVRLVTLRSDYQLMARSLIKPLIARFRARREGPPASASEAAAADNTNPYFEPAFRRMVSSGRPIRLVFAETDQLYWEFDAKFAQHHAALLEQYAHLIGVHVTKQANHIFSFPEWQQDMLDQCSRWLDSEASGQGQPGSAHGQLPATEGAH